MKFSGVYKIQSIKKPKRVYIGSAVNISKRWLYHLEDLRKNKHHSRKLQRHFNKYGEIDLQFSILLGCDKNDLLKTEQYFIDSYNPYFNNCKIAGSQLGVKRSEKTRKKMSLAKKGYKWSKESIAKRIKTVTGMKRSKETCNNLSKSHLGHLVSKETREKISIRNKGRVVSEKARENLSKACKGRKRKPFSEEWKYKLGNYWRGRELTDDIKKKMSDSHKKRWALRKLKNIAS